MNYKTIKIGSGITVVGEYIKTSPCGMVTVSVYGKYVTGWPVSNKEND